MVGGVFFIGAVVYLAVFKAVWFCRDIDRGSDCGCWSNEQENASPPNPFYAKTGWSAEYFFSGLSYIWLFLKQYGFVGILIAVPIAAVGRMNRKMRLPLFITAVYFIYILMVGGDVLHGHRFFMVVLPLLYLMFFAGIDSWLSKTAIGRTGAVYTITALIILATAGLTQ